MASNGIYNYNRKEAIKNWQPIPNLNLPPEVINSFNNKIKTDHVNIEFPEIYDKDVDPNYLQHVMVLHMYHLISYSKGVFLGNIDQNLRFILNEIINDEVDEKYYLNTKEILSGYFKS